MRISHLCIYRWRAGAADIHASIGKAAYATLLQSKVSQLLEGFNKLRKRACGLRQHEELASMRAMLTSGAKSAGGL